MRGFFGIGIEHGKTVVNLGTLWRSAHLLGADFIFTIGRRYQKQRSDTMKSWRSVPLWHFESVHALHDALPRECLLVGIELIEQSHKIESFVHPERCTYLLGAEDHGLTKDALALCHSIVRLPGDLSMNVACAGTVIMYDRLMKAA